MEFQKGELLYIHTSLGLHEIYFQHKLDGEYIVCTYGKVNKILKAKISDVSKEPELAKLYYYKSERKEALEIIEQAKRNLENAYDNLEKLYDKFKDLEDKFPGEFI